MHALIVAQENSGGGGSIIGLLPLLALPVIFYFLLIRPQRRKQREQESLLNAIAEGDEVMTSSGVYGFVTAIEDDIMWIEIAEGVDVRVARGAVVRRITEPTPAPAPAPEAEPDKSVGDGSAGSPSS